MIISEMKALLDLFEDKVPDRESNRLVWEFCNQKAKWSKAHELFSAIRERNLATTKRGNELGECQYCFEEACAKTLYNLTGPSAPFDADSPYWVVKNALFLARALGISTDRVVDIVASSKHVERTNC